MSAVTPKHLRQTADLVLEVCYLPRDALKAYAGNAREHPRSQINQIVASMRQHGFVNPILIDEDGEIIAGHGRLKAAKALGLERVPTICLHGLSKAQKKALRLADNKIALNASWNPDLLKLEIQSIAELEIDFDFETIGFSDPEVDCALNANAVDADDPDDAPAPAGPLITRLGDVWEVLGHRVVCGDALAEDTYGDLMADEQAGMIVADVPYNVTIQGNAAGFGKVKYEEFAQASGEMTEAEYTVFLLTAFALIAAVAAAGALAYVFIDWRHLFEVTVAARRAFADQRNLVVWNKGVGGQGSFYRSAHELVTVWTAKPGRPRNNVQLGRFGRSRTNVWDYPSPSRLGHAGEEGRLTLDHPTPKPVALIADAILDCTARGDIVLDPFLGGGATLIAAERTGRRCRGIEIEPRFVDAAIRRLRRLTGEDARRVSDGRMFADLEREAGDDQ